MNKSVLILLCGLLLVGAGACRKTKSGLKKLEIGEATEQIATPVQAVTPADSLVLEFKELNARMRVTANLNGRSQSFNAQMRWHKGEKIWMSMNILGIEGLRVLITKDSIQWIDRLNNEFLDKPYSYLSQLIKLDIPFESLERILIGLPAFMDTTDLQIFDGEQVQEWRSSYGYNVQTTAFFGKINNMLIEYSADDAFQQRNLMTRYGDYRNINGKFFPFERFMKFVQRGDIVELNVKFSEVNISENLSYPFDIPSKYKRVE